VSARRRRSVYSTFHGYLASRTGSFSRRCDNMDIRNRGTPRAHRCIRRGVEPHGGRTLPRRGAIPARLASLRQFVGQLLLPVSWAGSRYAARQRHRHAVIRSLNRVIAAITASGWSRCGEWRQFYDVDVGSLARNAATCSIVPRFVLCSLHRPRCGANAQLRWRRAATGG